MAATTPEVVVLSFGGNDDQPMHTPDGGFARIYTPEWEVEYARRVGIMMDIALAGGTRTVIWLGLPVERPEQLNTMKDKMNAASIAEAAKRQDVHFADLAPLVERPRRRLRRRSRAARRERGPQPRARRRAPHRRRR